MTIKYSSHFLHKLEEIFTESDFHLRYEKGNFKSGYCVLKDTKIIMVNSYYPLEGKINCLIEIIRSVSLDQSGFGDKSKKLYAEILASSPEIQPQIFDQVGKLPINS